jgi:hypothetical protein
MYGYRTKTKLLEKYLKSALSENPTGAINPDHFVMMREFCKQVAGKKDGVAAQFLLNMSLEGYFDLTDVPAKKDMKVTITVKGINAGMAEYFRIKQHEFLWKAIMNVLMTASTVAVAIIAIITIRKDIAETKALEERIKQIEKAEETRQGVTNPNTLDLRNANQTNAKDSSTSDSMSIQSVLP